MKKDFDGWNEIKKKTEEEQSRLYTVREIRVVDTKRLEEKVGFLDADIFSKLRKTTKDLL